VIGQTLGLRYEIQAQIVEGPIFTLFSARDRITGKQIGIRAVKEPFNSEPGFIQSLVTMLPKLTISHPAVEFLHEVLEEGGKHYLLSDMPKGSLLTERIKRFAPFTVPVAISTVLGVAEALVALHNSGIAHGDVGAHNIVATHDGSAKLQMAGIWRAYPESRTAGAAVLVQMATYLAPEVCTGQQPSASSDIYSLGVILFELLTGRKPFEAETPTATTMRHINSPVPSLRGINASIPVAVEQLVNRMLAKDPTKRVSSSQELVIELRTIGDQLRFGRTPTVKKVAETTPVVEAPAKLKPKERVVEAKNEEPEVASKEKKQKVKRDRDVPTWLLAILAVGFLVAAGYVVSWVAFLAQKPREIRTPNLKGVNVNEAREQARKLKLKVRIVGKESSDRVDIDRILKTRPESGTNIREGGTIDVTVSSGSQVVKVPNLLNMTADEAKIALGALNLTLDGKPSRITSFTEPPGMIIKQMPEPNKTVGRFSKVRVWIAAPSDAVPGSLPGESDDDSGLKARSFKFKHTVKDVGWEVRVVVEMTDESGTKVVKEGYFNRGDTISITEIGYGERATFRVTYDGEVKDTQEIEANKMNQDSL
jgi:eukaryotic-like serine/threonine-protein kinase